MTKTVSAIGPDYQVAAVARRVRAEAAARNTAIEVIREEAHCFQFVQHISDLRLALDGVATKHSPFTSDVVYRDVQTRPGSPEIVEMHLDKETVVYSARLWAGEDGEDPEVVMAAGDPLVWESACGRFGVAA